MIKVSGFTIARNIVRFNYPVVESIQSILPICDEFVINVGDSQDDTLKLLKSIVSPKIKIIQNRWDMSKGKEVLSFETNRALKECSGDWAFYLQLDEVVHQADWPRLLRLMQQHLHDDRVEAFRFKWFHYYGSYYRYRIDRGWYQKQNRIIRNNRQIESMGDAWGFKRCDGLPLKEKNSGCYIYHYGWVQSPNIMHQRRLNAQQIGFVSLSDQEKEEFKYLSLDHFPVYYGSHPNVMAERIQQHPFSQEDKRNIHKKFWWHPLWLLKVRYKTFKRVKHTIQ